MNLPDGWLSDNEASELQRLAKGCWVLELGAWKGRSTVALAQVAAFVWSVDTFHGDANTGKQDTFDEYARNLRLWDVSEKVRTSVGAFADIVPGLDMGSFDVVFVDGEHSYASTREALDLTIPRMQVGAMVLVHDYSPALEGVIRAVDERTDLYPTGRCESLWTGVRC